MLRNVKLSTNRVTNIKNVLPIAPPSLHREELTMAPKKGTKVAMAPRPKTMMPKPKGGTKGGMKKSC